ncbi:MAG: hypothetical protein ACREKN_04890 [Longimicrobiaceae bacterium]
MLVWLLFMFVAVGAKVLLALATIYLLLPADSRCSACDGETLLLQPGGVMRLVERLSRQRVQRRWCPRCGREGVTRTPRGAPRWKTIRVLEPRDQP